MADIDLIYFNAGGGHRAAARALETVIADRYPDWNVRSINLFEILDPAGRFHRYAGVAPEDFYNKQLALGWTLGLEQQLRLLQVAVRAGHGLLVRRLSEHWRRSKPDMVVSVIPNINRALHDSLRRVFRDVPYVTVMTDLADYPPHFWVEPDTTQHVICGTERAYEQARAAGIPSSRIHRASGMIVRPDFYAPLTVDRQREQIAMGLDPARPTGLVMCGGHGSMAMLSIARQLDDVQLILMCGHNGALARKLRSRRTAAPHHVVEFTPEVRRYMALSDFFIGKPGPGSLSEAVQQGLPVITFRNRWTMPQERFNTDWVTEQGLGVIVGSTRRMRSAVSELLGGIDAFKANVERISNRAVFEVPDILASILAGSMGHARDEARVESPEEVAEEATEEATLVRSASFLPRAEQGG
jgi:UDP-N-acetylglucosamine:LPS N-acetylglucosamine transferase